MSAPRKFQRRLYENAALLAVRKYRTIVLFWARRCRKSTTLGSIAFDEMSKEPGRSVIAASASLLLGTELVGMTLTATEQAALVANEAAAMQRVFSANAEDAKLDFKCANGETGKVYAGLTPEDFAELYKSSKLELRLYHDKTTYSRLKIIAPNPATARGWAGTVLRDEAGYTPAGLENDLRVATKPIMDTDPTFKMIYASNLCPDDRHPFFEMTMPPVDLSLSKNAQGNFYRGQTGVMVHRVTLSDAYAAGHVLYDDFGKPLTYEQFVAKPENKLGKDINYDLNHKSGGSAAIDLSALLTAQRRGASQCAFVYIDCDADWQRALQLLRALVTNGKVGLGFDVATTTNEKSNPSSLTVTEQVGVERLQRLVAVWKEKQPQVARERLKDVIRVVRERPAGGPAVRLCIDATNEKYFAEDTRAEISGMIPISLIVSSVSVDPLPVGYKTAINYKTLLGDLYSTAINDNRYGLPPDAYVKKDHRLTVKDKGLYACTPDDDGAHGDTFDSGKLAEYSLIATGGALTSVAGIRLGASAVSRSRFVPRALAGVRGVRMAVAAFWGLTIRGRQENPFATRLWLNAMRFCQGWQSALRSILDVRRGAS
jgi:hypothetical protein